MYITITWRACENRMLGPSPRVPDSAGLRSGPRIFISNKFLGDTDVAGPGTTPEREPLF